MLQVNASTLRFWEKEFDFIRPRRNKKGTRFYTAADIEKVRAVFKLVKEQGYTLQGAREKLKNREEEKLNTHAEVLSRLRNIRSVLIQINESL